VQYISYVKVVVFLFSYSQYLSEHTLTGQPPFVITVFVNKTLSTRQFPGALPKYKLRTEDQESPQKTRVFYCDLLGPEILFSPWKLSVLRGIVYPEIGYGIIFQRAANQHLNYTMFYSL